MSLSRKKALERLESLAPRVIEHLARIEADPNDPAVAHWKTEVAAWLTQMDVAARHVGKRTGKMWFDRIGDWKERLEAEHGDG